MNDTSDNKKVKLKIGVLGDIGVGKSTLINHFLKDLTVQLSRDKFLYLKILYLKESKRIYKIQNSSLIFTN